MLEIPNLNVVYEDETGTLLIHDIEGKGQLLVLHAEVIPTTNREILAHYAEIINILFNQLREKGVLVLKAWVLNDEQLRYATFFGFVPTGKEVKFEGVSGYLPVYELEKVLN